MGDAARMRPKTAPQVVDSSIHTADSCSGPAAHQTDDKNRAGNRWWKQDQILKTKNKTTDLETKNHRLRGSGSTVVMMTSKVNGTMEISNPCRSETPESIETKIGQNDYVMGPINPANFRRNR